MPTDRLSIEEFRRKFPDQTASEPLAIGQGWAVFGDPAIGPAVLYRYGNRDADLAFAHPPSQLGNGDRLTFVSPVRDEDTPAEGALGRFKIPAEPSPQQGPTSPVLRYLHSGQGIPQIHVPRRAASTTRPPAERISGR
jgi:hypothetical protein